MVTPDTSAPSRNIASDNQAATPAPASEDRPATIISETTTTYGPPPQVTPDVGPVEAQPHNINNRSDVNVHGEATAGQEFDLSHGGRPIAGTIRVDTGIRVSNRLDAVVEASTDITHLGHTTDASLHGGAGIKTYLDDQGTYVQGIGTVGTQVKGYPEVIPASDKEHIEPGHLSPTIPSVGASLEAGQTANWSARLGYEYSHAEGSGVSQSSHDISLEVAKTLFAKEGNPFTVAGVALADIKLAEQDTMQNAAFTAPSTPAHTDVDARVGVGLRVNGDFDGVPTRSGSNKGR